MQTWYCILIPDVLNINGSAYTVFKVADLNYFDDNQYDLVQNQNYFESEEAVFAFVEANKQRISDLQFETFIIQCYYRAKVNYSQKVK